MSSFEQFVRAALIACILVGCRSQPPLAKTPETALSSPSVIPPPESFFQKIRESDREPARKFYRKYIDVKGMPVTASAEVDDLALQRTYDIVTHLLAGRPDVLQGHGHEWHAPDHHRQRPGLHRHAGVSQHPQPGLPERARPRHRRVEPHQLWRGKSP